MTNSLKILRAGALFLITLVLSGAVHAQLSRADATRLLTLLGDKNVVVAGVVNGLGRDAVTGTNYAADNAALVIAYAERDGKALERRLTFFYDHDLGWFYSEIDTVSRRVRLWTTTGYRELLPPATGG